MIVITGAAGFIGSCLVRKLNDEGFKDLVLVDDFSRPEKERNLTGKRFKEKVDRDGFFGWLEREHASVEFIYHIGARTDTTEFDREVFEKLNLEAVCLLFQT